MRTCNATMWAAFALVLGPACGEAGSGRDGGGSADEGIVSAGTGSADASADDDGTGSASQSSAADEAADGSDDGASAGSGPKFDLGVMPDIGEAGCSGKGGGEPEFSYLWAANSTEGTISKIDTQTVQEVGRYRVRPDSAGNPSRTSVSLAGHVAVANRSGGVAKIYATPESCADTNGSPGVQTSNSPAALAWGEEECIAWYTPFAYASQRPVAWTPGVYDDTTCTWGEEKLWTSGTNASTDVILMDGDTGAVIDMVTLAGFPQDFYGIYGGASDAEGNFWGTKLGGVQLVRVDIDDLSYEMWPVPTSSYGMTVDSDGYVWACSSQFSRFDPMTETWQTGNGGGYAGCMAEAGADGLLWMAGGNSVIGIDRQTLTVAQTWPVPGSYGISIDYYGYVWAVAYGNSAHRVDKTTGQVTSYNGLVGAYTYSDMTGYALAYAGGGAPSG